MIVELQELTVEKSFLIGAILVGLVVVSGFFNQYIDKQEDIDPLASNSAIYTVLGVTYTLVAAMSIIGLLFGWSIAFAATGVVLVCFGVSGVPMIFGDMRRGSKRRQFERKRQEIEEQKKRLAEGS